MIEMEKPRIEREELDLEKGELIGEVTSLYSGSMKECVWVEGPHIYHIGDYYYITCAEMGTCFEHSISVARSKNLLGPYENFKCNPLLTHRHLGAVAAAAPTMPSAGAPNLPKIST